MFGIFSFELGLKSEAMLRQIRERDGTSKGRLVISQGTLSGRYTFLPEQDNSVGILHVDGLLIHL
jgi:hypothetical protein